MRKNKSQADIIAEAANEQKLPFWPFPPLESFAFPTGPKPSAKIDDNQLTVSLNGISGADLPPITGSFAHQNIPLSTFVDICETDYPEAWGKCDPKFMEKDPSGKKLNEPGAKADSGKIRPWLMMAGFARALEEVSRVTTEGALKYTDNGWVSVPGAQERYLDAANRHLLKYAIGEKYDNGEGGIGTHHLAQVAWNILAVLELQLRDDE